MSTKIAFRHEPPTRWQQEMRRDAYYRKHKARLQKEWEEAQAKLASIQREWEEMGQFSPHFQKDRPWEKEQIS